MSNKTKAVILVAIVAVIAFYGGTVYSSSHSGNSLASARNGAGQFAAARARFGNGQNGAFSQGQIISKDDQSITIKMPDGSSKIVFVGTSTEVMKTDAGRLSDLQNGQNVVVAGTPNSDGSITGKNIQIRPAGCGFAETISWAANLRLRNSSC